VRLFLDGCEAAGESGSLLFLDVVAAFASLLRKIVFQVDDGDEAWLFKLKEQGFQEADISSIYEHLTNILWISKKEGGYYANHSTALVLQFYTNTLFSYENCAGVSTSCRGSAAGTPLANIMYGLAMSKILKLLQESINKDGIVSEISAPSGKCNMVMASFHDDLVIPITSLACNIVNHTSSAVATSVYVFNSFGLQLNFSNNKSEAIVAFNGIGANNARIALMLSKSQVPVTNLNGEVIHIRFVNL